MNEVATIPAFSAASFVAPKNDLTPQQKALLGLLQEKIHSNMAITREDILTFYIENVKGGEEYKVYGTKPFTNSLNQTYEIRDYDNFKLKKWRDTWNIRTHSVQWFKNNLGAVIIKGKILIIPIIEIEETTSIK